MPDELVTIGVFARAARLSVKALRHYDELGVLRPAAVDPVTGYRRYAWAQLADALCVTTLREVGVPLDAVRAHLVGGVPLRALLAEQRHALQAQQAAAERALAVLDRLQDQDRLPTTDHERVDLPDLLAVSLRREVPGWDVASATGHLVDELLVAAAEAGHDATAPVWGEFPLTLTDPVPVSVHLPVAGAGQGGVGLTHLPGGRFVRALHVGPVQALPLTYRGLLGALGRSGTTTPGRVYERYLDDPRTVAEPRTEVLVRLAP